MSSAPQDKQMGLQLANHTKPIKKHPIQTSAGIKGWKLDGWLSDYLQWGADLQDQLHDEAVARIIWSAGSVVFKDQ